MARILVIDDEPNVLKMVRLALVHSGHTVEATQDGPQGLGRFGDGSEWDLALVDERMPGMPGRDVIREARRRDPGARLMMVTSFDTPELASEVVQAGATDFLRKPFTIDVLRGAVAAALQRPRRTGEPFEAADGQVRAGVRPSVSQWLNGYTYWPTSLPEEAEQRLPHGLEAHRVFEVCGPLEDCSICVVGVMPHVRQQIEQAIGTDAAGESPVWDVVCAAALADYLWHKAVMPPSVLPVYQLALAQIDTAREAARAEDGS